MLGDVTAAVNAARGDPVFGQYLAESAWLSSNPAEALLYQSHLLMSSVDSSAPHASDRWDQNLTSTMKSLDCVDGVDGRAE